MMKRSVFLKIAVSFVSLYVIYTFAFCAYNLFQFYDRAKEQSFRVASNYLNMGRILLLQKNVEDLSFRLDDAMKAHEIGYYLVRKNGEDVVFASSAGADDPVVFANTLEEGSFESKDYRHLVIHEGDFVLAVGYKTSLLTYAKNFWELNMSSILKDLLFVSLLVLGLVVFSFRDLISILKGLKTRNINRADATVARSRETFTLIQGFKGYQQKEAALTKENLVLKGQVLPALQNELRSGKTPPYEFTCTLVRTDINNFTSIFSSQDRAQFMGIVNDFFHGIAHIVSRYSGFVYEFIGDEVIFYFKDDDHKNSAATALSASRDINRLAEKFTEKVEQEHGYSLHIKTSLSSGTLRFGPLVNGFSLAGNPLIETVRMLSHVHEKSANTILFDDTILERVGSLSTSKELGVVILKGLAKSRRLHVYHAHVPLSNHLRQEKPEHLELIAHYRSNQDICEILDYLRLHFRTLNRETLVKLLSSFHAYKVTESPVEIRQSYLSLLEFVLAEGKATGAQDDNTAFGLTSLISAASHLFPPHALNGRLREGLLECLKVENRRVLANTLDVFAELDPDAGESVFDDLIHHDNNRIAANALVKQGKRDWNRKVSRSLQAMLKAQSPYYKASALYALGEIARHLKVTDEVAFQADLDFQKLIERGCELAAHANKMVRRQSLQMTQKAEGLKHLERVLGGTKSLTLEARTDIQEFLATISNQENVENDGKKKASA